MSYHLIVINKIYGVNMKKLFLLIIVILSVFAITGCVSETQELITVDQANIPQIAEKTVETQQSTSMDDVAKHNVAGDCWTVIDGKIYNLDGRFFRNSESQRMYDACGNDGTDLFYQIYADNEDSQGLSRELVMLEEFEI